MKTVTQNSEEDYITFPFQLPEGWITKADDTFVDGDRCPRICLNKKTCNRRGAIPLQGRDSHDVNIWEGKKMYKDLFGSKKDDTPFS